jgi:peptidoglycan/xylan/chitin deacetylase (PgdA/CDA1 family)
MVDERKARRQRQRRRIRRQRLLVAGTLVVVAVAIVAVLLASGGGASGAGHEAAAPADEPYPDLYVTRPDFHRQMDWLDDHGYEAVTLDQVEAAWYHGATLPPKPAVISFDDGYRPQFTYALPELGRHGWAGVLNLKAEGSDLYPSNVEAMIAAGWEVDAHTIHHLDLTELDNLS